MSQTTGIILATAAITVANQSIFHDQPVDWRVPIAGGLVALVFNGAERIWPQPVVLLAWTGMVAVLLTRTTPGVPSPTESALTWWNKGGK